MKYLPLFIKLLDKVSPWLAGRIVFALFCKAKPTEGKAAEDAVMRLATEETIRIKGDDVVVYTWGNSGKTVLLVHGWESRASRFFALAHLLAGRGYRVVAFDAPGHGRSQGDTVTILDYLEIMQVLQARYGRFAAIIAHSLGALKTFYAIKHGIATDRMIAISSVCRFNYIIHRYASFFRLGPATIGHVERRLARLFRSDGIWENFSVDNKADLIGCDVLLIHDRKDEFVEFSQSEKIRRALGARARLVPVDDVGHFRILSAPQVRDIVARELCKPDLDPALAPPVVMPDSM